jgi:hypothetical protein
MEIGDELANGDELVEGLAGESVEELLHLLLLVRVLDLVVLEGDEHLISCPAEDVEGLAAELVLDDAEQGLVGGARLLGLGLVDNVVGEGEDRDVVVGGGTAPALGREVGVRGGALLLALGLGELLLELGRLGLDGAVTERPGVDLAPESLRLAGGLVGVAGAGVGGEDEAGVGAVLVLLEARVRLGATAAKVGHAWCNNPRGRELDFRIWKENLTKVTYGAARGGGAGWLPLERREEEEQSPEESGSAAGAAEGRGV